MAVTNPMAPWRVRLHRAHTGPAPGCIPCLRAEVLGQGEVMGCETHADYLARLWCPEHGDIDDPEEHAGHYCHCEFCDG